MKKIYLNPTLDIVEIDVKNQILSGSIGAEGGSSDGGVNPSKEDDPSDPDWGWDF